MRQKNRRTAKKGPAEAISSVRTHVPRLSPAADGLVESTAEVPSASELIQSRYESKRFPDRLLPSLTYAGHLLRMAEIERAFEEAERAYRLHPDDGTACLMWLKTGFLAGKPVTAGSEWLRFIDRDPDIARAAEQILQGMAARMESGLAYMAWASSPFRVEFLAWAATGEEVGLEMVADANCVSVGLVRLKPGINRFHKPAPAHDTSIRLSLKGDGPLNRHVFVPVDMEVVHHLAANREREMACRPVVQVDRPMENVVDVIVPVYKGMQMTIDCIASVRAARTAVPFNLVVIDDASPEPELSSALRKMAAKGQMELLVNARNLGFVGTVNRGMSLHPNRHVLLLNSDTLVYDGWLDEMVAALQSRRRTGTVTSLATSATICSYPEFLSSNGRFDPNEHAATAALARQLTTTVFDIPTGVGNCMLINRLALDDLGLFDDDMFAKGYGEENDFSRRCAARGWRNVCAPTCFTTHFGEVSFGGAIRGPRVEQAAKKIHRLHPDYDAVVQQHIQLDPLAGVRRDLDILRLKGEVCQSVYITHGIGGGIETYVKQKSQEGSIWVLTGQRDGSLRLEPGRDAHRFPNLKFGPDERHHLIRALRQLDPVRFDIQSLVAMPWDVCSLITELNKPHGLVAHDYAMFCHQVSCMDGGNYCGNEEADLATCTACMERNPSLIDWPKAWNLQQWRQDAALLVTQADSVSAPSEDTARRYRKVFHIKVEVKGHLPQKYAAAPAPILKPGERVRVAVIGAIGPHKGYHPTLEMMELAQARHLPIDFYVVGYTMDDPRMLQNSNTHITGAYKDEAEARWLLTTIAPHVALYMPQFPETWCYTLDIIFEAGIYVMAKALGALEERMRHKPGCKLLPAHATAEDALAGIMALPRKGHSSSADVASAT